MALKQRALITAICLSLLLGGLASAHAQAQDAAEADAPAALAETTLSDIGSDDLRTAFRRMKREDGLQFELDTVTRPPPDPPPGWIKWIGDALAALFEVLAPLVVAIFWMGVGALAMVLLYALALGLVGLRERIGEEGEARQDGPQEYRPSARTVRVLLSDADALAAQGRFAEAVHLLLYRSIQDIEQARPDAVRLSLTSREIARSALLGTHTRTTFAALARMVERSHFGGDAVSADDYAEARGLYERFAAPTDAELAQTALSAADGATA